VSGGAEKKQRIPNSAADFEGMFEHSFRARTARRRGKAKRLGSKAPVEKRLPFQQVCDIVSIPKNE
jgi:hypothetical protein